MITPTDVENLDALLGSAGWEWLSTHVLREWGPSGLKYQQAVRNAAESQSAVIELQKVIAAQDAVHAVMRAPADALAAMKARGVQDAQRAETAMSRRGPGL